MRSLLLAATMLLPASLAAAATLRPMTTLHAPVVLLSDLFDDAGRQAARVLGPAPGPGERIVVEARQLAAIARMFGVAWHPTSPADRAILERPGKVLPRALVLGALRAALVGVGAPAECDIDLPGFEAPMVPVDTKPEASIEQLDYDAESARFTAGLLVTGEGMAPMRLRLTGRAEEVLVLPVPSHRLEAGSVISAFDLQTERVRAHALHADVARDQQQVLGMRLRRPAAAGEPLALDDLMRPGAVEKGASVTMQIQTGGLTATAQGLALSAAAPGERIRVLNPLSRMVVSGEVLPSGIVAVAPGSMAAPATAQEASAR
jgi:flagella basal body P-ring formation protein FlgA